MRGGQWCGCPHVRPSARRGRPQAPVEARPELAARDSKHDHVRLPVGGDPRVLMRKRERGQVLVIVAVWMLALIGSAALILLTGSVEWQRNQLQQLADGAATDSALTIGVGCTAGSASTVITQADNFLATQRTRTGSLSIGGSCAAGYTGTDTFAGALSETVHYPYRAHQQQIEVILTVSLPISFGNYMGASTTSVTRRAVAQQLPGSTAAVSATTLSCTGGRFNVGGSIATSNAIALSGSCAVYAHQRYDAASGTYSDLGNVSVYAGGQSWVGAGGSCGAAPSNAVCADGFELSGHTSMTCGTTGTSAYLTAGNATINPNPCAAGKAPQPVPSLSPALPPEPNADAAITATLPGAAACASGTTYANVTVNGVTVGKGNAAAPSQPGDGYVHFSKGCYGYLDIGNLGTAPATITQVQRGPESAPQKHFVTATLAASTAGTLLVATVRSEPTPNKFTAPAPWTAASFVSDPSGGRSEIWYVAPGLNPGGIVSVTFTVTPADIFSEDQVTEWRNVVAATPLDQTGTFTAGADPPTATVPTSRATPV